MMDQQLGPRPKQFIGRNVTQQCMFLRSVLRIRYLLTAQKFGLSLQMARVVINIIFLTHFSKFADRLNTRENFSKPNSACQKTAGFSDAWGIRLIVLEKQSLPSSSGWFQILLIVLNQCIDLNPQINLLPFYTYMSLRVSFTDTTVPDISLLYLNISFSLIGVYSNGLKQSTKWLRTWTRDHIVNFLSQREAILTLKAQGREVPAYSGAVPQKRFILLLKIYGEMIY